MVSVVGKQAGQDSNSREEENKWSEINTVSADCLEWASTLQNKKEEPKPNLAVSLSYRDKVANLRSRRWVDLASRGLEIKEWQRVISQEVAIPPESSAQY